LNKIEAGSNTKNGNASQTELKGIHMPVKPLKPKFRKRILTENQQEHLIEGFCLDSFFPFENEAQRRSLYFENKEYLIERTKDARRKEDHFFYTEGRELPQSYFDYEDERGIKKYARRYLVTDSSGKVIGDSRTMWPEQYCKVV